MITSRETGHLQVPFQLRNGEVVNVDNGLIRVLRLLNDAGVETLFSCQGGPLEERGLDEAAYIVGRGRGFHKLIRKIRRMYRRNRYSSAAAAAAQNFLDGFKEWEIAHFTEIPRQKPKVQYRCFSWQLRRWPPSGSKIESYAYEWDYSLKYGYRITVRWPYTDTDLITKLLEETLK